jgi:hypothetical protein
MEYGSDTNMVMCGTMWVAVSSRTSVTRQMNTNDLASDYNGVGRRSIMVAGIMIWRYRYLMANVNQHVWRGGDYYGWARYVRDCISFGIFLLTAIILYQIIRLTDHLETCGSATEYNDH